MACLATTGGWTSAITQPRLRAATKRWAVHDLLRRRGASVTGVLRAHVAAVAALSESLHAHRQDHGLVIGELGRHDIEMFLQRLASGGASGPGRGRSRRRRGRSPGPMRRRPAPRSHRASRSARTT